MKVYVVLVEKSNLISNIGDDERYILAVYSKKEYAEEAKTDYLKYNPHGWTEVQSFYVV